MTQEIKSFKSKIALLKGPIGLYFLLAIAITWAFWIPTILIASANDYFLPSVYSFRDISTTGFKDGFLKNPNKPLNLDVFLKTYSF